MAKKKPRKGKDIDRYIRDALEHDQALMNGETPKKARIIEDIMPSRGEMISELKHLPRLKPIGQLLLAKGKWFKGRANVRDYPKAIYWQKKYRPQPNQCFQNARDYCLAHPESHYFEGCFVISLTPIEHAWVVMEDGNVVDFTVEAKNQEAKKKKGEVHITPPLYLGIEVPQDQLSSLHDSVRPNEPILELYHGRLKAVPKQ